MPARQGSGQAAPPGLEYKAATAAAAVGADAGVIGTDDETGVVEAIVSVTGVVDNDRDIIEPGAYASTLTRRRPKGIFSHDWKQWASRTEAAEELMPGDPRLAEYAAKMGKQWPAEAGGLYVRTRYNLNTPEGKSAYENVKFFGPECEWSIGYRVPPGKSVRTKDGTRRIREVDLFEYSPVLFGAASLSGTLSVKSAQPGGEDGPGEDGAAEVGQEPEEHQDPAPDGEPDDGPAGEDGEAVDVAELAAAMDALALDDGGGEDATGEGQDAPPTDEPENPPGEDDGDGEEEGGAPDVKWDVHQHLVESAVAEAGPVAAALAAGTEAKADGWKALGHVSLDRSPRKNWVELAGQLPAYIQHIARDLHNERGMPLSRAIPTAIAAVKRWAAGGGNVKPDTRAKAAAAVAEWEALKARSHARAAGRKNDDTTGDAGAADDTAEDRTGHDMGWLQVKAVLPGSLEEFRDDLREKIAEMVGGGTDTVELLGTWPDRAVVVRYPRDADKAADTFEVEFTLGEGGAITLSEPEPVTVTVDDGESPQIAGADLDPFPAMVEDVTGAVKAFLAASLGDAETKSGDGDGNGVETKAGRVLSGVNATRLKSAVENLVAVLKAAGIEINAPDETDDDETEPQETDSTAPSLRTDAVPEGKVLVDPSVHARALRIIGDVHTRGVHADA